MCVLCSASSGGTLENTGSRGQPAPASAVATVPSVKSITWTGSALVDALLAGTAWSTGQLTYAFPALSEAYTYAGEPENGFAPVTSAMRTAISAALGQYASIADLTFTPGDGRTAVLRFARTDEAATAQAYYPHTDEEGGDVWFNRTTGQYGEPVAGNYAFHTVLHEIGHALGLKHAHDGAGDLPALSGAWNSMNYTVMTYASYAGADVAAGYVNEDASYAQSLMMLDIAAIQEIYGANYAFRAADTVYRWDPGTGIQTVDGAAGPTLAGNRIFMTVWDGGGRDTYDFSNYATALAVDLAPGRWTTVSAAQLADLDGATGNRTAAGNIANALLHNGDPRALIENAVGGSAGDRIKGNIAANALDGRAGHDSLFGGAGDDTLTGGEGGDLLSGGPGFDWASFASATRPVTTSLSGGPRDGDAIGDRYATIEGLIGSAFDDRLVGGQSANGLVGGECNDRLSGNGGADTLDGGAGNDTLTGGTGTDWMTGGQGSDLFLFLTRRDSGTTPQARDTIVDFETGIDRIDVSKIDADVGRSGNQAFEFISAFALPAAGQLSARIETIDGRGVTVIALAMDGDADAELEICLLGRHTLSAIDFVL